MAVVKGGARADKEVDRAERRHARLAQRAEVECLQLAREPLANRPAAHVLLLLGVSMQQVEAEVGPPAGARALVLL